MLNREEVIRVAAQAKPTAKLREKFQYQNVMYAAAGEILGRVEGSTWEKLIAGRIFKPLGMKGSNTSVPEMQKAPQLCPALPRKPTAIVPSRSPALP